MQTFRFTLLSVGFAVGLFLGMLLFLELGRRLGVRQVEQRGAAARSGVGVVDAAVYSVLALLIGFIFSGATSRFDSRRQLVIHEVDAIRTAWHRIDMLPADPQPAIRAGFERYLDALIASYRNPTGSSTELRDRAAVTRAQKEIWALSVAACSTPSGERARMLLLPALNEMFAAVEHERLARLIHPPRVIFVMLALTALAAALFAGYSIASGPTRNWFHMVGVAATISLATYVIIEIEYPRVGLVRMDAIDQTLVELRQTID